MLASLHVNPSMYSLAGMLQTMLTNTTSLKGTDRHGVMVLRSENWSRSWYGLYLPSHLCPPLRPSPIRRQTQAYSRAMGPGGTQREGPSLRNGLRSFHRSGAAVACVSMTRAGPLTSGGPAPQQGKTNQILQASKRKDPGDQAKSNKFGKCGVNVIRVWTNLSKNTRANIISVPSRYSSRHSTALYKRAGLAKQVLLRFIAPSILFLSG